MTLYFGLYGRIINKAMIYCSLKKVYLTSKDIQVKGCDIKRCKHRVSKKDWDKIESECK
jgi:hypothetical protein